VSSYRAHAAVFSGRTRGVSGEVMSRKRFVDIEIDLFVGI